MMVELVAGLDRSGVTFSTERVRPKPKIPRVFLATPDEYGFETGNTRRFLADFLGQPLLLRALIEILLGESTKAGTRIRLTVWSPPAPQPEVIEFAVPAGVA